MPRTAILLLTTAAATLAGCGERARPVVAQVAEPAAPASSVPVTAITLPDWRVVATTADRERARGWRTTWLAAVTEARRAEPAAVAAEALLFEPDRPLPGPLPPPGEYRCRTFKLGARGTAMPGYVAYPFFRCRVDAAGMAKLTGSQRPSGRWSTNGTHRAVFLGTLALGDERGAIAYGRDPNRDLIGLVERIGERRWRVVFPEPRFESRMDVMELVPAG